MGSPIDSAILRTICYSDIFDYPLSKNEINTYLSQVNSEHKLQGFDIASLVKNKKISFLDGYYCLRGRESIIALRKEKERISKNKLLLAGKVAQFLSLIPTIRLIAISGSLAMSNAYEEDDIDFFIITQKCTLWLTRLATLLFLQFLGVRRSRKISNVRNKICVNMFIDESSLLLPKNKQNLFTGHEIIQMKPIFVREDIYNIFIQNNAWIGQYFNSIQLLEKTGQKQRPTHFFMQRFLIFPLEKITKWIQLLAIKKHRTTEIISDTFLAFHPNDNTPWVLEEYNKRRKRYGI